MSRRRSHTRTNRHGTTFSVREHSFNKGAGQQTGNKESEFRLIQTAGRSYINGDLTFAVSCPACGARVYFYQKTHGSRVFFNRLGKPWPKHQETCPNWQVRFENDLSDLEPYEQDAINENSEVPETYSLVDLSPLAGKNTIGKHSSAWRKAVKNARQNSVSRVKSKPKKKISSPRISAAEQNRLKKLKVNQEKWEADGAKYSKRQKKANVEVRKRKQFKLNDDTA